LLSIHDLNYVADFGDWTNCMRTYAVRGERGHLVESYPGGVPEHPMPYWSEVWTGLEYVYAIGLAQEGLTELAEDVVVAVRERFSGKRRNPFDEAECGHHYARAMASWGLVVARTGFQYDGREGVMTFAPAATPCRWFWSTGAAWGTVLQASDGNGEKSVRIDVLDGRVRVDRVQVGDAAFQPEPSGELSRGSYQLSRRT
jgi:non-lysosomal glucosylceramidase